MNAECQNCKKLVSWYGGRGRKLSDVKCPDCGGPLGKGSTQICSLCGSKKLERNMSQPEPGDYAFWPDRVGVVPVGGWVCGTGPLGFHSMRKIKSGPVETDGSAGFPGDEFCP